MITNKFNSSIKKFNIFAATFCICLMGNTLHSQNWQAIDRLLSSDLEGGDNLGISIAIDGEYMVAGAWWEDNDPFVNSAGAAYVFKKDGTGNWAEDVKLVSPNPEVLGYFGFSTAIDDEIIVVGVYNENVDDGTTIQGNAGAVYIYYRQPDSTWLMEQRLEASDLSEGDLFGYNIALSGTYLLVGAWSDAEDANGGNTMDDAGSVYVFERQLNGTWNQVKKLVASDRAAGDNFGKYVDIRGDRAIVGAFKKDDDPNFQLDVGAAYIFERNNSTGDWSEVQKLMASDRSNFDNFGWDVAIDGDKAFVGARHEGNLPGGGTASNTGAAYFFERDGSGTWIETQKIYASDHTQNDFFAGALDLDGNIAVIGAEMEDEDPSGGNTVSAAGSAYIYERQPNGVWQEVQKVIGENRGFDDLFGASVSIRDDQIAVGAWLANDTVGVNVYGDGGAAYIFRRNTPLAVNENSWNDEIQIVPNPSHGLLRLLSSAEETLNLQLSVYDLFGKKVFEAAIVLSNSWEEQLPDLPAGMYVVSLRNERSANKVLKWMKL